MALIIESAFCFFNRKCKIQSTLINLHPNESSQEIHYYLFAVKLDRCVEICKTLNDLSNKACTTNKTEDLNLRVFNMIRSINGSKALAKHVSCERKCKLDGTKCNSNQWWNKDKCRRECKKHICQKEYVWNLSTCNCENGKYLASIMDDSVIMCDEIIEKTVPTNFNEKKANYKTQNFYILLAFLLITIALLVAVSIYRYLIKYREKHLRTKLRTSLY